MKRLVIGLSVAVAFIASGCTVQKELVPTGGSRADGVVNLSYEVGLYEKAQVNMAAAQKMAFDRCAAWGYTGAQPFGAATTKCTSRNGYGHCMVELVTVQYQCTGAPKG